jgi:hypothetical protein
MKAHLAQLRDALEVADGGLRLIGERMADARDATPLSLRFTVR